MTASTNFNFVHYYIIQIAKFLDFYLLNKGKTRKEKKKCRVEDNIKLHCCTQIPQHCEL